MTRFHVPLLFLSPSNVAEDDVHGCLQRTAALHLYLHSLSCSFISVNFSTALHAMEDDLHSILRESRIQSIAKFLLALKSLWHSRQSCVYTAFEACNVTIQALQDRSIITQLCNVRSCYNTNSEMDPLTSSSVTH